MEHYDVHASSWAEGHHRVWASRGPIRFRLPQLQVPEDSFLRKWTHGKVWAAINQPAQDKSNLTKIVLFVFRDRRRRVLPESVASGFKWFRMPLYRKYNTKSAGLYWRFSRRRLKGLFHPTPIGRWHGILTINAGVRNSTEALLELDCWTLRADCSLVEFMDKVHETPEPEKRIVVPGMGGGSKKLILPDEYRKEELPKLQPIQEV